MAISPRKYLSVHSVAARYECHPSSVWRWVAQGKFPHPVKIGGMTRWLEAEVEAHDAQAAAQREDVAAQRNPPPTQVGRRGADVCALHAKHSATRSAVQRAAMTNILTAPTARWAPIACPHRVRFLCQRYALSEAAAQLLAPWSSGRRAGDGHQHERQRRP